MSSSRPYDGRAVANFLLDLADEDGLALTQLHLLKLIYFSHGWFLASNGLPLIQQSFEAWDYGPVVRVVRDAFKVFGKAPITSRAERFDIFTGEVEVVEPSLQEDDKMFVKYVYLMYQKYDAWELSEMTHEQGSPWDKLWNAAEPLGRLALRISNDEILSHFTEMTNRASVKH